MKLLAIRERTVPISAPMRNASVSFDQMTASALAIVSDRVIDGAPVVGYAFDSIGRYGKGGLLRDRFIPRLLSADPDALLDSDGLIDPDACVAELMRNEKDGGHGERPGAVGLIDAALWDLRAKLERRPLWRVLADRDAIGRDSTARLPITERRGGPSAADASVRSGQASLAADGTFALYGSCGHFRPGRGQAELAGLAAEVRSARDSGFNLIKIKLGGASVADDQARTEAAMGAAGPARIAVDVNGRLAADIESQWFERIGALGVAWIEEPAPALDYQRLARQSDMTPVALATGENLFSFDDARNLLRYGGLRSQRDRIQVDVSLSYGVGEYRRILDEFAAAGWDRSAFLPHAGHLFAAQVVAGLKLGMHESASDLSLAFGGLWDDVPIADGRARAGDHPGVGFEAKAKLFECLRPLGEC